MLDLPRVRGAGGVRTVAKATCLPRQASSCPRARRSPPATRQTTRRASEVCRDRARPATATTCAFSPIGDDAGGWMVARATDHHQRRARSRSSPASRAAASQKIAQHNKRTAESEASPPSVIPAAAPYRPSHRVRRPRGTSKPRRVDGVHVLRPLDGVQRLEYFQS